MSPRFGTCSDIRLLISVSLDGELSEFEHAMLHAHLVSCVPCAQNARHATEFIGMLRSAPLEPLPFPIAIPRRRGGGQRLIRAGATVAAVVAAIGVGLGSTVLSSGSAGHSLRAGSRASVGQQAQLDDRVNWAGGLPRVAPSELPVPLGQRQVSGDV